MAPTQSNRGAARAKSPFAEYGLSKKELAETIGLAPEALHRRGRLSAPKTQSRLREMSEILTRVSAWAGGPAQAMAWYRAEPIPIRLRFSIQPAAFRRNSCRGPDDDPIHAGAPRGSTSCHQRRAVEQAA